MGNSYGAAAPTPAYEKKPKGRRVHLAPLIAEDLIKQVVERVILDPMYLGKARECYEMSKQLRNHWRILEWIVKDHTPGSALVQRGGQISLSEKITMVFVNYIDHEIIRPGPTPEDRDSGDVKNEIYLTQTPVTELIRKVIQVEDEHEGLTT